MIYYAFLNKPIKERKTHHYAGGLTNYKLMPIPNVLIIEEDTKEGGFMLYRYTKQGEFCGDTWHPNLEEAKEQAEFEYGDSIGGWKEIPENVKEPIEYALNQLKKN